MLNEKAGGINRQQINSDQQWVFKRARMNDAREIYVLLNVGANYDCWTLISFEYLIYLIQKFILGIAKRINIRKRCDYKHTSTGINFIRCYRFLITPHLYIPIPLPSTKLLRIINKSAADSARLSRMTSSEKRTQSKMVPISGNFPSN